MRARTTLGRTWHSMVPDMAPFSGITLALIGFFLLTSFIRQPTKGLVPLEQTPCLIGSGCFNAHVATETIISLAADGRVSFAISDTALQASVFSQVGAAHSVTFTASQLNELGNLPYLATNIEQLPATLLHSLAANQIQAVSQQNVALSTIQLVECVSAVRLLAPSLTHYPTSFFLYISAETDASKVMELLATLQKQGINHCYLMSHDNTL